LCRIHVHVNTYTHFVLSHDGISHRDMFEEYGTSIDARQVIFRAYEPIGQSDDNNGRYPPSLRKAMAVSRTLAQNNYALFAKEVAEIEGRDSITLSYIKLSPEFWKDARSSSHNSHTSSTSTAQRTPTTHSATTSTETGTTRFQERRGKQSTDTHKDSTLQQLSQPKDLKTLAHKSAEKRRTRMGPPHPRLEQILNTSLEEFVPLAMLNRTSHASKIPHHLLFTYKTNVLQNKTPPLMYENVLKTIDAYRQSWNESDAPVWFLTDEECELAIGHVRPEMLTVFATEDNGSFKADICRVAALYLTGGYYFDIDLRVMEPVHLDPDVSFATVEMIPRNDMRYGYFFQAFIAVEPHSALMLKTMDVMVDFYRYKMSRDIIGPKTMRKAFNWLSNKDIGKFVLLQELNLEEPNVTMYSDLPRQHGVGPGLCNYIVHDAKQQVVHFFSRIVGSSSCKVNETLTG
jgi:hypothetical protein